MGQGAPVLGLWYELRRKYAVSGSRLEQKSYAGPQVGKDGGGGIMKVGLTVVDSGSNNVFGGTTETPKVGERERLGVS